jgi:hypothetical protein
MMHQLIHHDESNNMAGRVGQPDMRNQPTQTEERIDKQYQIQLTLLLTNNIYHEKIIILIGSLSGSNACQRTELRGEDSHLRGR